MGKTKRVTSQKFSCPLYCAAWAAQDAPIVAGGGGKKTSGISSKAWALKLEHDRLATHAQAECSTGWNTAVRMAAHPAGKFVVLGVGPAGLLILELCKADDGTLTLELVQLSDTAQQEALQKLSEVNGLSFSNNGKFLAAGGDGGWLTVLSWPALEVLQEFRGPKSLPQGVRDVTFSAYHKDGVLATTCEDGSCSLWHWAQGDMLHSLKLPAEFKPRGSFKHCCFAQDGSIFAVVNAAGVGYILQYRQDLQSGEINFLRQSKICQAPITAFDVSADGTLLGVGTSEGDIALVSAADLRPIRRVNGAHMVFVTAVAMSPGGHAMLSVSADASALCTTAGARKQAGGGQLLLWLAVLVLLLAVIVGLAQQYNLITMRRPLAKVLQLLGRAKVGDSWAGPNV